MLRPLLAALAAVVLTAAPAAVPAQQRAAATDWTRTVTLGPNGAFVLGNPDAATKLVEYLSYTCPHCGHFQAQGVPALKAGWVRHGQLSIEYRNFVRDPYDLAASLLARCGGAARFLANHEALFANQDAWMKQAQAFSQSPEGRSAPRDQVALVTAIAEKIGLFALLAKQGLTPAAQRACLADKQALSVVLNLTAGAWDTKEFSGTPFFLLNGKGLDHVHDWEALRPLLPALPPPAK